MITGTLPRSDTTTYLTRHPTWQIVFDWLTQLPSELSDGTHEINGDTIYASVQTTPLITRDQGTFESHQQYLDLHYCLSDGEIIEYAPQASLTAQTEYNHTDDYQLWNTPPSASQILLVPGSFAIFFPDDAHLPKLTNGTYLECRKLVVKIHHSRLTL